MAEVAVLRFRNCLFAITGSSSCIISSASMRGKVLSADCGKDMEAEARAGSEARTEAGFGVCILRFLGEGASSN